MLTELKTIVETCSHCSKSVEDSGFLNKNTQKKYLCKGLCHNCYKRKYNYGRLESVHVTPNIYPKRLMSVFSNMKNRCYNQGTINYENYGGRGIVICNEWINNLGAFYKWSLENGYKDSLTIDRINYNGNYEPDNCRWVNQHCQQSNRRNNNKVVGVAKFRDKWQAYIDYNGNHYCKKFDSMTDAISWRKQKEVEFNIYK